MSGEHVIPVRAPKELREKLEAEAKASDRSLSATVRVLLAEAFSRRAETRSAA
jgi:hypothetical protein